MVAVGCFTRWQWGVGCGGVVGACCSGCGSELQWWLLMAVDCGGW